MALLSTATSANLVIERALSVYYTRVAVKGSWSWVSANVTTTETLAYEYHRYASCAYRYVGMDYTSAKAAADSIRDGYTRSFYISRWQDSGNGYGYFYDFSMGERLQASVEVVRREGHLYDVVVDVNEDDVRMSLSPSTGVASLFVKCNSRTYGGAEL